MQAVEINLIWLGRKELPTSQEENFKKLIENNKPPSTINVWTDDDSRSYFETLSTTYKDQGLIFNVKEISSLRNDKTVNTFECVETLYQPNGYYSAMGDYFKALIVGRSLVEGDVPFRLYSEFDDIHPEIGFTSKLSELGEIPPIMWRYNKEGAIEPDFLAINMASPIGQLSAQYLVSFTEEICTLKKSNETDKTVFVVNGADPHVVRRYVGEHLNYAVHGLKFSMEKTEQFKNGFNFGYENALGATSKRKQGDDKESSSWESTIKIQNEGQSLHLHSPELKLYHGKLLAPYNTVITEMKPFCSSLLNPQKIDEKNETLFTVSQQQVNLKKEMPTAPVEKQESGQTEKIFLQNTDQTSYSTSSYIRVADEFSVDSKNT